MRKIDSLVREPSSGNANACTIILHGLGANGHDMEGLADNLQFAPGVNMRFIMPHAPVRGVTINHGMPTNSWFDIKNIDADERSLSMEEFGQSVNAVLDIVKSQSNNGVPSKKIFVMGFSQGGAVAFHVGMVCKNRLAGVAGLSTYLPLFEQAQQMASEASKGLPVFIGHGMQDDVVPVDMAVSAKEMLEVAGYNVSWNEYRAGAHEITKGEIQDIQQWMDSNISE